MTAEQDARRWMKEFVSHQGQESNLLEWDEYSNTEARIQFTNDLLNRFADAFCWHAAQAEVGTLQIFALPACRGVFCVACLPPPIDVDYLESDDCDWCRRSTNYFTEVVFTYPEYALHVTGNVCDDCTERLRRPNTALLN